jgi:hypothetical protein
MADDAPEFHFNLVDGNGSIHPIGKPVSDRDQAFAVAKRLAIDTASGCFISVVDDTGSEIHREGVDSAEKSG